MEKQFLVTERAHFMCPNMHFGMLFEIEHPFQEEKVKRTLDFMADAHPFLKSLIAYEEGTERLYYKVTQVSQIEIVIRGTEETLWNDYQKLSEQEWNVFKHGLLKVYVYPNEKGMKLLFITHHLLVDGKGGLELAQEFANMYVAGEKPIYVEEHLLQSITELPLKSKLSGISRLLIKQANNQWKKENHFVTYETYQEFVIKYAQTHAVKHDTFEVTKEKVTQMSQMCHENGFTMNDLLMAKMFQRVNIDTIIMAADIRKMLPTYQKGALGNYATAMGIKCKKKLTDEIALAKQVHSLIQKHMSKNSSLMLVLACYFDISPTLLDAAAISALGGFESKAGTFVGQGMFHFGSSNGYSITNLGKIDNQNLKSIVFIPPASPAAKYTLGVVTLNGVMRACSSQNV